MLVHHQNQHTAVVRLWQRPGHYNEGNAGSQEMGMKNIMAAISGSSALCMPELQACQTSCIANKHLRIRTGMKWNFSRTIGPLAPKSHDDSCDNMIRPATAWCIRGSAEFVCDRKRGGHRDGQMKCCHCRSHNQSSVRSEEHGFSCSLATNAESPFKTSISGVRSEELLNCQYLFVSFSCLCPQGVINLVKLGFNIDQLWICWSGW